MMEIIKDEIICISDLRTTIGKPIQDDLQAIADPAIDKVVSLNTSEVFKLTA